MLSVRHPYIVSFPLEFVNGLIVSEIRIHTVCTSRTSKVRSYDITRQILKKL